MNKYLGFGLLVFGVIVFGICFQIYMINQQSNDNLLVEQTNQAQNRAVKIGDGRYVAYDQAIINDERYTTTILFFYSSDCQECMAFDGEIAGSKISRGVQILRVDSNSRADLKQKYEVATLPSFVRINPDGTKQQLWDAYGRTKTVEAIIENTQ